MEVSGNRKVIAARVLQNYPHLTVQAFQVVCQLFEFAGGVAHFKRFGYDLAERAHNSDHAFAFGHIDPNSIHGHTSKEKIV